MSEIVCQVGNRADQVEFIWSTRGGYFKPYVVAGIQLTELRQAAGLTRKALEELVFTLNDVGSGPAPWESSFKLVEAGFQLYNKLLPGGDETALKVRRWLEDLRKQSGSIGLEIVVEEGSGDPGAFLSVPWNLVYDEYPEDHELDFQAGEGKERWRPFWAIRYNLTTGRRVEPWKRLPVWSDPRVIVVIDPTVYKFLPEEQRKHLDEFLAEERLTRVGSLRELKAALRAGYPRLLYWLGHATPEYLRLGDTEEIHPSDLRNLLSSYADRERPEGMLAFLNACQTAEAGSGGSFLDVLHSFGFTGAIATERQTIDTFANEFGLAFLRGFLREGRPLGELLHSLRLESAPLGLIYGAHCPPEIRVRIGNGAANVSATLPIRESRPVTGVSLGAATLPADGLGTRAADRSWATPMHAAAPPLPDEPYRSLAYYDENDRALFTGRDADVVRFAATLDRPDTRILILHGESGTGKSSFLRAGVIPYLEEECVGYRFFRRPDGAVLIIQAAKDLVGQLAQALLDATATSLRYDTPDGEPHRVNLRRVLDEVLGTTADYATLREALRHDVHLLADMISRMAGSLPYALVLVLDQAEEVFTLAKTPEEVAGRDHGLRMLQRLVDVQTDVKLIVALRTEYYGRLLDHLRAGRRDLTGVRDDLLRDFSRSALIEAITRPTSETPLAPGQPAPREQYGFRYAEGIPEAIADGVLALRSENQDSVLPLVQVICTQLYEREKALPGSDRVITRENLDAIKGVEGGLRAFAEDALVRSMRLGPEDRQAFKGLFSQLYNRQTDGTLTTWLMPRESLQRQWDRPTPFADLLAAARSVRLLREDELRIEGGEPRRYVRLGHDALAKVAAAWKAEREENQRLEEERTKRLRQRRRLAGVAVFFLTLAGLFGWLGLKANREAQHARTAEKVATTAQENAKREAEKAKKAAQEARDKEGEARAVLDFVKDKILAAARPKGEAGGLGHDVTLRKALEATLPQVETSFQSQPLVEASVRMTLGDSFRYLGDDATAEQQYRIARDRYTARLGPDHPDTLLSMNNLANSYAGLGRQAEALKLREETLALRKAKLGPDHPDTLASMNNLATSYYALGRHTEALKLREEALALQKAKLGPDHPYTLASMNNLARSYAALGRQAEALKLYEETLVLRKAKHGPDHPETLWSMNNLATSYADLGRHAEALKLGEETLALRKAKLGPDHPDTLLSMYNLAVSYAALGRQAEALKLREETLALQKAKLGPDHPNTLLSMYSLAQSLVDLDRPSESVAIIDDCLRRVEGKVVDPRLVPFALELRLRACAKQKDASGCRQTAELWEKLDRKDAGSLYNAACYRAVTAGVLRADDRTPHAGEQADAEADIAMGWLAKAVAAGYDAPQHLANMARDRDLDALRDRADFRRLLGELFDRGFPKDPFAR